MAINPNVDVLGFFQRHVLVDLLAVTTANVTKNPILMADLLKFLLVFRNQLPKDAYGQIFPILSILLTSPAIIVHTYAACCLERFLTVKDGAVPRVSRQDLQPMLQPFLTNLFGCLAHEGSKENPHIMKCVMRAVSVAGPDVAAVAAMLVGKLTEILGELCKSFQQNIAPKNPAFHHFIFETLAAVIKHVCADAAAVATMEGMMLPPFQTVIQMDITEFQPYFIQIISQLLESRPLPVPDTYMQILTSLLQPPLWQSRSNQPALTRLIKAYMSRAGTAIVANQATFHQILGLIQTLMVSKVRRPAPSPPWCPAALPPCVLPLMWSYAPWRARGCAALLTASHRVVVHGRRARERPQLPVTDLREREQRVGSGDEAGGREMAPLGQRCLAC